MVFRPKHAKTWKELDYFRSLCEIYRELFWRRRRRKNLLTPRVEEFCESEDVDGNVSLCSMFRNVCIPVFLKVEKTRETKKQWSNEGNPQRV